MKWLIIALAAIVALANQALAEDTSAAEATQCDSLPPSASIEVFSNAQTREICRAMLRVLDGVRAEDISGFSKAAYLLSDNGYQQGNYTQIARELVDIVRFR